MFSTVMDETPIMPSGSPLGASIIGNGSALQSAANARGPRQNWSRDEIRDIYNTPLMELAFTSVRLRLSIFMLRLALTLTRRAPFTVVFTRLPLYRCAH